MFALFVLFALVLSARAVDLQVLDNGFLSQQGEARYLRTEKIAAHRGRITDRNGEPIAVSTPVDSVWANPQQLSADSQRLPELARALERDTDSLRRQLEKHADREFTYLRRHMRPALASKVLALEIPGRARAARIPPLLPGR